MSYIKLKHALAEIALGVLEHPERVRTAEVLLAYARRSGGQPEVPVAALARGAGVRPEEARRLLLETGLFADAGGRETVALAPPFRPFAPYLRRQAARTVAAARRLASPVRGVPAEISRAAALWNAGLFFECHEYLEEIWRAASDAERAFYHGLVQAAAGFYHLEKGNAHGARTLLRKAIAKLQAYAPTHRGIDVPALLSDLGRALATVEPGSPHPRPDRAPLPALPLVSGPPRPRRARPRRSTAALRPFGPDEGRRSR